MAVKTEFTTQEKDHAEELQSQQRQAMAISVRHDDISHAASNRPDEDLDSQSTDTWNIGHALNIAKDSQNELEMLESDIGKIINATESTENICNRVNSLSVAQKYNFVKHHDTPGNNFIFPTTYIGGCNRSFKRDWLREYPWLVYSSVLDGAFCICCAVFAKNRYNLGILVNKPFCKWNKKSEILTDHVKLGYHQDSALAAETLIQSVENPCSTLPVTVDERKRKNIETNRHILKCIIECVLFCGRQCIGLRGDGETNNEVSSRLNPGNFIALLRLMSGHDEILQVHLNKPALRNCTYISPVIQNQLIEIIGKDIIQKSLVGEVKDAKYFSILADEVTSHNKEQIALCLRFVDKDKNIREEFLEFLNADRITGEYVAYTIKACLETVGLDLTNIRGQGYDGAANMASNRVGLQARIRQYSPRAVYVHCSGHCLNLVIAHSCSLVQIRNMIDKLKAVNKFFRDSPKREGLLIDIVNRNVIENTRRKPLLDLCRTRWAERHIAYSHFYEAYVFIVRALDIIYAGGGNVMNGELSGDTYVTGWDPKSRSDANSLQTAITSFDFIISFMITYQLLSHLSAVTVKLQGTNIDILEAYAMIQDVKDIYTSLRDNMDETFRTIYSHAVRVADKVGVEPSKPRNSARQCHRVNTPADNVEQHYLRNVAIPFLDFVIIELDTQFSDLARKSSSLLGLVPAVICENTTVNILEAAQEYHDDLPYPELLEQELVSWKLRYQRKDQESRPDSCSKAICECDELQFPNIFTLLKIACTIPVTSCQCERSASALRRLHTYTRASMGQNRLSALALIHIHYNAEVSHSEVAKIFSGKHPRRLELDSLLL